MGRGDVRARETAREPWRGGGHTPAHARPPGGKAASGRTMLAVGAAPGLLGWRLKNQEQLFQDYETGLFFPVQCNLLARKGGGKGGRAADGLHVMFQMIGGSVNLPSTNSMGGPTLVHPGPRSEALQCRDAVETSPPSEEQQATNVVPALRKCVSSAPDVDLRT